MDWTYKGKPITELPNSISDFVYEITYVSGKRYIGKKRARTIATKPPLKSGNTRPTHIGYINKNIGGKRVKLEQYVKELPWRAYTGSSTLTKDEIIKSKEILYLCTTGRTATYLENKLLYAVDAPINNRYLNESIGGRIYSNCLTGLYESNTRPTEITINITPFDAQNILSTAERASRQDKTLPYDIWTAFGKYNEVVEISITTGEENDL